MSGSLWVTDEERFGYAVDKGCFLFFFIRLVLHIVTAFGSCLNCNMEALL